MVFQISISILCLFTLVAVIAVILSFDTPPFAIYAPVSFVCCGLWIFCHCCHASHFCNCFHELLDFTFTNWLLGVPQCRLRFCQTFRPLHVLYINSPWLPTNLKSLKFIWRCSWTPLVPKCWLRVYHNEWFRLSELLQPNAPLSHSSSSSSSAVRGSAFFFVCPSTFTEFDGLSVQHLTATLKSLVFQEAVWSSISSKMAV